MGGVSTMVTASTTSFLFTSEDQTIQQDEAKQATDAHDAMFNPTLLSTRHSARDCKAIMSARRGSHQRQTSSLSNFTFRGVFLDTHLSQVCQPHGRCESCRPCSPEKPSCARACWGHPWGSSWPSRGAGDSSCGAGTPEIRGVEPKTCGETVRNRKRH